MQVTRDHSLVSLYEDNPSWRVVTVRQNDNVIVRAVRSAEAVEVEHQKESMQVGDVYLLCCDGPDRYGRRLDPARGHARRDDVGNLEGPDSLVRAALSSRVRSTNTTAAILLRVPAVARRPRRDLSPQPVSRLFLPSPASQYAFI